MHIVILTTTIDRKEADLIGEVLVGEKLAACVNIVEKVHSIFWWKDKCDKSKEILLIIKTQEVLYEKVEQRIKELHSYDVPEIIALPIVKGNMDYLKWIDDSVDQEK